MFYSSVQFFPAVQNNEAIKQQTEEILYKIHFF